MLFFFLTTPQLLPLDFPSPQANSKRVFIVEMRRSPFLNNYVLSWVTDLKSRVENNDKAVVCVVKANALVNNEPASLVTFIFFIDMS